METLPLTPNKKIDRKALPVPGERSENLEYAEPRNPTEAILVEVWKMVLRVNSVGIHDDFFESSGDSLLATRVINELRGRLKIELPLRTIFEKPTIAELSERIEEIQRSGEELAAPPLIPRRRATS